jgi:hypothetical protein
VIELPRGGRTRQLKLPDVNSVSLHYVNFQNFAGGWATTLVSRTWSAPETAIFDCSGASTVFFGLLAGLACAELFRFAIVLSESQG